MNINITHDDYSQGREGMGGRKIVHRIVLVRHGETESNKMIMSNVVDKKTLNTPLTAIGQRQGVEVATYLVENLGFQPNEIIYSPLDRTYNTALPTLNLLRDTATIIKNVGWVEKNFKRDETIVDHENETWEYNKETKHTFTQRVTKEFDILRNQGSVDIPKQTLVFTHSQVINEILCQALSSNDNEENCRHFFHLSNGSITCIDIDEDRVSNVQTVNFSKHISIPTGQHSPFV